MEMFQKKKNLIYKLTSAILAFVLCFADVALLGTSITQAAETAELNRQTTDVKNADIDFDAYFQEEGTYTHSKDIQQADTLYLSLKVRGGYLADAAVTIAGANFKVLASTQDTADAASAAPTPTDGYTDAARAKLAADLTRVESISDDGTTIRLNKINSDESLILEIPIEPNLTGTFDIADLTKTANVTLTGTYVADGKERSIDKTIGVQANIAGETTANLKLTIDKFVPFDINQTTGTILQTKLTSTLTGDGLPVAGTTYDITIPTPDGISPDKITISANSTGLTNGRGAYVFDKDEYEIENGHIKLTITNDDGKLTWNRGSYDEILLTYIYNGNKFEDLERITLVATSEITYYGGEAKTATGLHNTTEEITGTIGEFGAVNIGTDVTNLYNGYMQTAGGKTTDFKSTLNIGIGYSDLVDKVIFKDSTSYIDENGNIFPSNALYTYTKISEENFIQVLGEDGYINVYKEDGSIAIILNKGNLDYTYDEELSNLTFEMSKPKSEGTLIIENGRAIKPEEYSEEQIKAFKEYSNNLSCTFMQGGAAITTANKEAKIALNNASTKAELTLSKNPLSTVTQNENVEIRIGLDTDNAECMLYKNPKIKVEMPSYITGVQADNVKLLYEDNMKISDAKIYTNENNCQVIEIALDGEQEEYNEIEAAKGATLLLESNIDVNKFTPTRTAGATLTVENEKSAETIASELPIDFQAPIGMVTINQLSDETGELASSMNGEIAVAKLEAGAPAKNITVTMTATNNYNYTCEDTRIVGRIPFSGNKSVDSGTDLGSNFDTKLVSGIKAVSGITDDEITVYYSDNPEATKDMAEGDNWVTDVEDFSNMKSFMIVLKEKTLATGESVSFSYDIEVPADLAYARKAYSDFTVLYKRGDETSEGLRISGLQYDEVINSTPVGMITESSADLAVEIHTALDRTKEILEEGTPSYSVEVTNNSGSDVNNVTVKVAVPSNAKLLLEQIGNGIELIESNDTEVVLTIDSIPVGETGKVNFHLKMPAYNAENEEANKVTVEAVVTVPGDENEYTSGPYTLNVVTLERALEVEMSQVTEYEGQPVYEGDTCEFKLHASANDSMENVTLTFVLPEGTSFSEASEDGQYNAQTRTVTWHYDTFNVDNLTVTCIIDKLPDGTHTRTGVSEFYMDTAEGDRYEAEKLSTTFYRYGITISQTCDIADKYIKIGDEVLYTITVQNISAAGVQVHIQDALPSKMQLVNANYTKGNETITINTQGNNYVNSIIVLESDEVVVLKVRAKASHVAHDTEATNRASASLSNTFEVNANEITHIILAGDTPEDPTGSGAGPGGTTPGGTNPGGTNPGGTTPGGANTNYSISGTAWVDSNKNGKRESTEALVGNMQVYLLRANTSEKVATTSTNASGAYTFSNVQAGLYLVAFAYDTNKYALTSYQLSGVSKAEDSDVVDTTLTIDGKTGKYGATNKLSIAGNMANIDIGLIDNPKFDLELEKSVSMIQISNSSGTKTYNFNSQELAKIEIPEKQIEGTVVSITYTITVKNTGAIAGYANKIVDYKARELTFNSNLNPEWYTDQSGNLYTTSLSNKLINPGETATVQLILTKVLTDANIGQITNDAEIAESSNSFGIPDADSNNNNKAQKDDDFSTANIIIAVNSGETYVLLGIIFTVCAIFAFGAYEINKRVLAKI